MTISNQDYKPAQGGNTYFKFKQGANKFRVVSDIETGYVFWTIDNKPVRSLKRPETVPENIKPDGKIKDTWVCLVYSFDEDAVQIMEVTQMTIIQAMFDLENNEDWGDTKKYNITITRTGEGMDTSYTVMPGKMEDLPEDAQKLVENTDLTLDEMWSGKAQKRDEISEADPF